MVNSSDILEVNESGLKKYLNEDKPVLVDFFADWCGPCKIMKPIVEEMSASRPDVKFVEVDVDKETKIADSFSISSIPTFLLFKKGKVVGMEVGAVGKIGLERLLKKLK